MSDSSVWDFNPEQVEQTLTNAYTSAQGLWTPLFGDTATSTPSIQAEGIKAAQYANSGIIGGAINGFMDAWSDTLELLLARVAGSINATALATQALSLGHEDIATTIGDHMRTADDVESFTALADQLPLAPPAQPVPMGGPTPAAGGSSAWRGARTPPPGGPAADTPPPADPEPGPQPLATPDPGSPTDQTVEPLWNAQSAVLPLISPAMVSTPPDSPPAQWGALTEPGSTGTDTATSGADQLAVDANPDLATEPEPWTASGTPDQWTASGTPDQGAASGTPDQSAPCPTWATLDTPRLGLDTASPPDGWLGWTTAADPLTVPASAAPAKGWLQFDQRSALSSWAERLGLAGSGTHASPDQITIVHRHPTDQPGV
jgi:hypothetical protein